MVGSFVAMANLANICQTLCNQHPHLSRPMNDLPRRESNRGGIVKNPPRLMSPIGDAAAQRANSIEPGSTFSRPSVLSTNHFGQAPPSPTRSAMYCLPSTA